MSYVPPFKTKHLKALERRYQWLVSQLEDGTANSYDKAELAALESALAELRDTLDDRLSDL